MTIKTKYNITLNLTDGFIFNSVANDDQIKILEEFVLKYGEQAKLQKSLAHITPEQLASYASELLDEHIKAINDYYILNMETKDSSRIVLFREENGKFSVSSFHNHNDVVFDKESEIELMNLFNSMI